MVVAWWIVAFFAQCIGTLVESEHLTLHFHGHLTFDLDSTYNAPVCKSLCISVDLKPCKFRVTGQLFFNLRCVTRCSYSGEFHHPFHDVHSGLFFHFEEKHGIFLYVQSLVLL